jgi:hypothetical protein
MRRRLQLSRSRLARAVITNLKTLVGPGYDGTLVNANDVNESGRITGQALDHATGALSPLSHGLSPDPG